MPIKGIDVSTHQGIIDWRQVKESGIQFAIIRTGYGDVLSNPNQVDKQFHTNMKQAIANGVSVGVYHFSYAGTEAAARREAEGVLSLIKDYSLTYPVYFDYEYDSDRLAGKLGKMQLTKVAIAFMERIREAGYPAGVYTNLDFVRSRYDMPKLEKYELWLAHYGTDTPGVPCGLHQTSESGSVPGIKGKVDLDLDHKGYTALQNLTLLYSCKPGASYQFLARCDRKPDILTSNVSVAEVSYSGKDSRGHLFTLKAKSPGQATITASLDNFKDSFTVEVSV